MSVDRDRVRAVFGDALDVAPEGRAAYLRDACGGDEALRREVESLLRHHHEEDLIEPTDPSRTVETLFHQGIEPPTGSWPTGRDVRYQEIGEIGVGSCGRVTSSWDRALRRRVARKELLAEKPFLRPMLLQEARLLAWLDHPGAVPVYDIESDETGASYTMRMLDGQTLRAHLDARDPLSVQEALHILRRVGETMANAHDKGVLHLDLKPANLMLLPYGQVCVLDWGLARFYRLDAYGAYLRASGEDEPPTAAGYSGFAGTPSYMPIEQLAGIGLGPATDIFAAGTILYEMLAGRLPHPRGGAASVLDRSSADITPLRAQRADIPHRLDALCLRMLAPEPSERPASFEEVLAELDDLHAVDVGRQRLLSPGEVLFREGDPGDEAFQILEGTVAVTVDGPSGPTELARRGLGELIGEMAVVLDAPRSATVTAVEPTRVAIVDGDVIARTLERANPLLSGMLRSLSERLRQEAERAKG